MTLIEQLYMYSREGSNVDASDVFIKVVNKKISDHTKHLDDSYKGIFQKKIEEIVKYQRGCTLITKDSNEFTRIKKLINDIVSDCKKLP